MIHYQMYAGSTNVGEMVSTDTYCVVIQRQSANVYETEYNARIDFVCRKGARFIPIYSDIDGLLDGYEHAVKHEIEDCLCGLTWLKVPRKIPSHKRTGWITGYRAFLANIKYSDYYTCIR